MACDPELADTSVFCQRYGHSLDHSANTIVVKTKTGERKFITCVLLATARLDVNHTVRKKIGAEETLALTGMDLGGGNRASKIRVTPEIFRLTPNTEIVEGLALPVAPTPAA